MLECKGIMSDRALAGTQAIALVRKRIEQFKSDQTITMYKLILLDYSMPGMDGPQVAVEMQNLFKQQNIR